MHLFPYSTIAGKGYIFSALDNQCSNEDISANFEAGVISSTYRDLLLANLYDVGKVPNVAYFGAV